ncbi:MAG: AbrB/MazE/SpoVT family DNA-binding domain-containing protein [Erysipelotrichaceae bacterium]
MHEKLTINNKSLNISASIQKWGNSQGIRFPKYFLDALNWKENERLTMNIEDGKIIIEKEKNSDRKNINELFANYEGSYQKQNIDWGEPEGNELW